jgi:hypothetical protein
MSKLLIYNQSPYFYHISEVVYNFFIKHLGIEKVNLINCNTNHVFTTDDVYLTFIPFNKLNIDITPNKYIVYNFEQFTTDKIWSESYINFLKKAIYVLDYSISNVYKMNEYGINSYFLPYIPSGLNKYNELSTTKKDIDILFIGNLNNKRRLWLKELTNEKYSIKIITNLFFEKSIEYFARSKIVLNIHYYGGDSILEVTRIIPALENNCVILTEESHDEYYNYVYKNIVKITDIDNLKDSIINILSNYNLIQHETIDKFNKISREIISDDIIELIGFIKKIIN